MRSLGFHIAHIAHVEGKSRGNPVPLVQLRAHQVHLNRTSGLSTNIAISLYAASSNRH